MAGNDWINGYLEAILDAGSDKRKGYTGKSSRIVESEDRPEKEERVLFSPTKYFVEEVVNSFDETDLYRTWIKVIATRNTRDRSHRLENICWRIWHLLRKKKQLKWDAANRLTVRHIERQQGRNEASDDLSELSEGEKEKGDKENNTPNSVSSSDLHLSPDDNNDKFKNLYIVLISLHGLVRGEDMELGRDSDTGGQVKYVVELARALANTKGVHRVDLLTRQITSSEVDSSYGEPIEMLSSPPDGYGSCGAYIIRLPCGPPEWYIPKESLWPHIPEFIDGALNHIVNMARALGEQVDGGKPTWPYVIHGHYADAGEVAAHLSGALNVPMVLTGHSLGRNKFEQLLKQGRVSKEVINSTYKIMRRIEAEEFGLDVAEMVVTSTRQEIEDQWGLYDGFDIKLERKLRVRRRRGVSCLGRYMPRMVVIPPGMDFSYVDAKESADSDADLKSLIESGKTEKKRQLPSIWSEIMRFFTNPHKPVILALSRPDPKKNVTTLLKAFGECRPLRELANLVLILGNRDDIEEMSNSSSMVLMTVLKLIDKYDLYGQVAYPKHHKQFEVPDIYRLAAKTKGVFINPALVEPFGLTIIEAAAYGLPVVATRNGGPVDILKVLHNGILVDPHDQEAIADALLELVAEKSLWTECRKNGLKNIHCFSWPEHCRNYLSNVENCTFRHPTNWHEIMPTVEEPLSESLRDVDDLSFKFSIEGEIKINGELDSATRQKHLVQALAQISPRNGGSSNIIYCPGRRQRLYVIATDFYNNMGDFSAHFQAVIKNAIEAATLDKGTENTGFVLLTGSTVQETIEAMKICQVSIEKFDALVCNCGSELYYPWRDMTADGNYEAHVEYRWPGENVRLTIMRIAKAEDAAEDDIIEYLGTSSSRCYSYTIKPGGKVRRVDDLRQRLRVRGFRCNLVYTRAGSRLNVIPLFASRIQAIRYLSVNWGIDLCKMAIFLGEGGDTDYEDLLGGLHKTLVLKTSVDYSGETLLRSEDNIKIGDISLQKNPNVTYLEEGYKAQDISAALRGLGLK